MVLRLHLLQRQDVRGFVRGHFCHLPLRVMMNKATAPKPRTPMTTPFCFWKCPASIRGRIASNRRTRQARGRRPPAGPARTRERHRRLSGEQSVMSVSSDVTQGRKSPAALEQQ